MKIYLKLAADAVTEKNMMKFKESHNILLRAVIYDYVNAGAHVNFVCISICICTY